jgi:hypothetical protein
VTSAAVILGDDSLLTKYLNPHLIGVLSSSSGNYGDTDSTVRSLVEVRSACAACTDRCVAASRVEQVEMRLVDTVSGRVLQSASHAHASPPLQAVRQENWFVYTFWNTKHKRTEIVSYAMFESSISRCVKGVLLSLSCCASHVLVLACVRASSFELNPFKPPRQRPEFSSFDTIVPVMLSRSFVLPAVRCLALSSALRCSAVRRMTVLCAALRAVVCDGCALTERVRAGCHAHPLRNHHAPHAVWIDVGQRALHEQVGRRRRVVRLCVWWWWW